MNLDGAENYTLRTDFHRGTLVVYLNGQLTMDNADAINRAILSAVPRDNPYVVLDLAEVTYADSSGLSLLFNVQGKVIRAGGRLAMTGLLGHVREVMNVSNYYQVFSVHDTVDEAVNFIDTEKKNRPAGEGETSATP